MPKLCMKFRNWRMGLSAVWCKFLTMLCKLWPCPLSHPHDSEIKLSKVVLPECTAKYCFGKSRLERGKLLITLASKSLSISKFENYISGTCIKSVITSNVWTLAPYYRWAGRTNLHLSCAVQYLLVSQHSVLLGADFCLPILLLTQCYPQCNSCLYSVNNKVKFTSYL